MPLTINNQTLPPLTLPPPRRPNLHPLPIQLNLQHPPNPRMKPPSHHNKVLLRNAINIIVLGVHIIAGPDHIVGVDVGEAGLVDVGVEVGVDAGLEVQVEQFEVVDFVHCGEEG